MKEGIHPKYEICEVTCACGNTFITRSTKPVIKVDICSACHPFYTGKQKMLDTAGMVEKFNKKFAATKGQTQVKKEKKIVKARIAPSHGKKLSTAAKKITKEKNVKEKK